MLKNGYTHYADDVAVVKGRQADGDTARNAHEGERYGDTGTAP